MANYRHLLTLVSILALSVPANSWAARGRSLSFSLSAGTAQFTVLSPSDMLLGNGFYLSLEGEKPFGFFGLYLESAVGYLKTTGKLNYNYVGSTANYVTPNVGFNLDKFQIGLGLRGKLIERAAIRPYIEAGGNASYDQITYDNSLRTPAIVALGGDFRTSESILDFGIYGEAGVEIDLSADWGLRLANRYMNVSTRPIETMKQQMVRYEVNIYMLSLFATF
jgi:hypothetical protein